MIKHHPTFELIQSFVKGELPASLSAAIAMHAEMCSVCHRQILQLTEQLAEVSFEESLLDRFTVDSGLDRDDIADFDFEEMIASITENDDITQVAPKAVKEITFAQTTYKLPLALNSTSLGKAANIGKLSRSRVHLDENEIHTSLLHIQPGGGVPEHKHRGFELTLLLDGSFNDVNGEYVKGDFILLDSAHQHHPISENGCLCYTVANDALHFTQGINKLLNPLATFIY